MTLVLWVVATYLLGAIPASYIAGRYGAGVDLRAHGSGNLGATNVYRVVGWRYAIPVAVFDVAKGAVPVLVAVRRMPELPWFPIMVGTAAVMGHVFPIYLRFRGGKGVATAAGVVAGLAPLALGISGGVWLAVLAASGFVSLASVLGAVSFPVAAWLLDPSDIPTVSVGAVLAGFIVYTHRDNIRRLRRGEEGRLRHRHNQAGNRA